MAGRLLTMRALAIIKRPLVRAKGDEGWIRSDAKCILGNRDIVGFGFNGQPVYADRVDFPFPAIRWKENTPDVQALREKEKGDWRKLSIEEKKQLYRASFCQTFEEMKAPTGEWKSVIGGLFVVFGLTLWWFYYYKIFVNTPVPFTFQDEYREAQLRRIIDLQMNPIEGISSKWDYAKDDWKK